MHLQNFVKSPLRGSESRKVYDYLKDLSKPIQKLPNQMVGAELSPYSKEQTDYELVVQFELRRQKQKTLILEERLKNKESFIKQMKQFQDQLTLQFQKCQQELQYYKSQCEVYESRSISFPTFNDGIAPNNAQASVLANVSKDTLIQPNYEQIIRQYVEEIAELKHLVIRQEEEINFHEKKNKNLNQKSLSYSSKYPVPQEKQFSNASQKAQLINLSPINKKELKNISNQQKKPKKQRSKTLANQFIEEKRSQNFTTEKNITDFIHQQIRKISSFINHFLTMCSFFDSNIQKQPSIGQKLKKAWKWVKSTIVEWKNLKKDKVSNIREFQIGVLVSNLIPVENLSTQEIQQFILKLVKKQAHKQI